MKKLLLLLFSIFCITAMGYTQQIKIVKNQFELFELSKSIIQNSTNIFEGSVLKVTKEYNNDSSQFCINYEIQITHSYRGILVENEVVNIISKPLESGILYNDGPTSYYKGSKYIFFCKHLEDIEYESKVVSNKKYKLVDEYYGSLFFAEGNPDYTLKGLEGECFKTKVDFENVLRSFPNIVIPTLNK